MRVDAEAVVADLAALLDALTFAGLEGEAVRDLLIDTVADWAAARGWKVYRRAPSVVRLPPPLERQFSCVDLGCARPDGPPVVIEVDRGHRRRTLDKLVAEAAAGRLALWIRWGTTPGEPLPPEIHLLTCPALASRAADGRRVYSRQPTDRRPAPHHTPLTPEGPAEQAPLFPE